MILSRLCLLLIAVCRTFALPIEPEWGIFNLDSFRNEIADNFKAFVSPGNELGGLIEEIRCYDLPYGGLGILSHLLTYYSVICIGIGRVPLWPRDLLRHGRVDIFISVIFFLMSGAVSVFAMDKCANRWQFICIGVWKETMSVTTAAVTGHRSYILIREHMKQEKEKERRGRHYRSNRSGRSRRVDQTLDVSNVQVYRSPSHHCKDSWSSKVPSQAPLFWLIPYVLGVIVGMTGLLSIVTQTYESMEAIKQLTLFYGFVLLAYGLLAAGYKLMAPLLRNDQGEENRDGWEVVAVPFVRGLRSISSFFIVLITVFVGVAAIYSDLVLAVIAGNWSGNEDLSDERLMIVWFIAKRLPLLVI
ncbi:hypothetical protein NA57DRAFT_78934 [Rhizodiscina lignyota]|uniref:Uncharacterized protein n=1 Tax=Rhizodiscina lignyota TaxID=1504668 RepID=A0A9P4I8Y2_9PEZI|nr:hypothetical protein NA57DRAFT_78934 [Rhizodiscina lignyota]